MQTPANLHAPAMSCNEHQWIARLVLLVLINIAGNAFATHESIKKHWTTSTPFQNHKGYRADMDKLFRTEMATGPVQFGGDPRWANCVEGAFIRNWEPTAIPYDTRIGYQYAAGPNDGFCQSKVFSYTETICGAGRYFNNSVAACQFGTDPDPPPQYDQEKELGQCDCPKKQGDPVNVGTGNNYQQHMDYRGAGPFPFTFERSYNSSGAVRSTRLGSRWRHTYDRTIGEATSTSVKAFRADGKILTFSRSGSTWIPAPDVPDRLEELIDAQGKRTGIYMLRSIGPDGELMTGDDIFPDLGDGELQAVGWKADFGRDFKYPAGNC